MRTPALVLCALWACLAACAPATPTPIAVRIEPTSLPPTPMPTTLADIGGVPISRLQRLKRGVNISRWFWLPDRTADAHFAGYITDDDLQNLTNLGVTVVRLVIDPVRLMQPNQPDTLDPRMMAHVDKAIDRLLARDIAVIVDMHDEQKKKWETDDAYVDAFVKFWGALAKHLRGRDPEMVFFELLNEPVFDRAESKWLAIQPRLIESVRANAPQHTIIATGPNWGGIDGLLKVKPLAEKNIVYSFHFYDPFPFTHQGATWTSDDVKGLMQVPYPVDAEKCARLLGVVTSDVSRASLLRYCAEGWDASKLDQRVGQAVNWAKQAGVPLFAGEFGVHCPATPQLDRLKWLSDVTTVFAKHNIGWASWSYDECFGLGRQKTSGGEVYFDTPSAQALGFNTK